MSTTTRPPQGSAAAKFDLVLQQFALGFPEAVEEAPWGHRAIKVRGKTFVFLAATAEGLSLSVKLPDSGDEALELAYCEPTGYGLGKSGWVSAQFGVRQKPPLEVVQAWIAESYRTIAPKRLVKQLDAGTYEPPGSKAAAKPAAKPARKQSATRPKRKA